MNIFGLGAMYGDIATMIARYVRAFARRATRLAAYERLPSHLCRRFAPRLRSGLALRDVTNRDWDRGGAIKSYIFQEMLTGRPDEHILPTVLLLAPIRLLAVFCSVALFPQFKHLRLVSSTRGLGQSRVA